MKHLRIEYIQITVDGLPEMHNQRRPLRGGGVLPLCMGGCPYKRMMGNVDNCSNYKFILDKCLKNAASAFQVRKMRENEKPEVVDKHD